MNFLFPEGLFTQKQFAKLNKIKHSKCAWRVLQRHVANGIIQLVKIDKHTKVYKIAYREFVPRTVPRRHCVCPPRDVDYIYMLMGYDRWGQGGGGEQR